MISQFCATNALLILGLGVSSVMKSVRAADDVQAQAVNAMDTRLRVEVPNPGIRSYQILARFLSEPMIFPLTYLSAGALISFEAGH